MSFEILGKIIEIYDEVQISEKFRKREFVIENTRRSNDYEFVETIKFQLTQDRTNVLKSYNIGDEVKVGFNIRGRRWEKDGNVNYFTNLEAWKIERQSQSNGQAAPPPPSINDIPPETEDEGNDLPF
ncbi:MAG: DUF3127 domain-containing protein [Bacteroidetes bacterium]|jgi:hypothetical protein|nr:DUF3127 domain-containing protein [Bacteroidota bacterium]MBT6687767.1 DUF3127 domain-containing protein [Bacteroidota bacterium]MBT7143401.1 DUF3127 domain-containing protein [Bacteroidota bacterium]MBT7492535.1 DUF3127 domain-containing protein [Bacteroidota bacterium]